MDTETIYYGAYLGALEQILDRSRFAPQAEVDRREQDWRRAYLNSPHGKPVTLADGSSEL